MKSDKEKTIMKAAIYTRKSTDDSDREGVDLVLERYKKQLRGGPKR